MSAHTAALILAGGFSRRMGQDKALVAWRNQPLWRHVWARLKAQRPQAAEQIWINTRTPSADYEQAIASGDLHGCVHDPETFAGLGPLAGMCAGLRHIDCDQLLVVPCDTPKLPLDVLARLSACHAPIAIAATRSAQGLRAHPTIALLRRSALLGIEQQLQRGELKLMHWLTAHAHAQVVWDHDDGFVNVNDAAALEAL